MKSRKRKILKLGIMCLMPLLALLITISNSYAYYLNNDGNIQSSNLFDKSIVNIGYGMNDNTGDYVYVGMNDYSASEVYVVVNGGVAMAKNDGMSVYFYDQNKQFISTIAKTTYTFNSPNNAYYMRYEVRTSYVDTLMLNYGSSVLPYEPYAIWYSTNNAYQPLNIAFNDCRVELLNYNVSTHNVVATTNLSISNSQLITLDNIPNLKTIIVNDEDTRYGLKFYLNNPINYILNFQMNNNVYQVFVALSNSVTGQSFTFEYGSNVENYNLVCNTNNNYYDTILYYTLLSPDYNYFSMYVNTDSASFNSGYGVGYAEGYDEGYDNGHYTGYNTGIHENGEYQRGYNDGVQQDLATSGFRTLITTILSYPVNMVRESLNFEFMGIHVASIVLFIVSLGIVAFVIKRFKD